MRQTGSGIDKRIILSMGAGLIDDFIRDILSVPFCPFHFLHTILSNTILSLYHFVHTILSVPFCPIPFCPYTILSNTILSLYHFVHTILSVPFCPLPFCPVTDNMLF